MLRKHVFSFHFKIFFFFNFSHGKRVRQKRKGRAISEQNVCFHFKKITVLKNWKMWGKIEDKMKVLSFLNSVLLFPLEIQSALEKNIF